jgi:SAM-dependent methyltransferase
MTTDLIAWKTNAWKDPGMVQWYAGQMVDYNAVVRIKNAIEIGLIRKHAVGDHLLDVGIGTGRGSLHLLRDGMRVTGIDSSQAMLDETARQAQGLPIELRVGDVASLPYATPSFDTILALNVMVHFPHWREVLANWRQALRPGGRIIFDIHSRDHYDAALGHDQAERELTDRPVSAFISTASAEELVQQASRLGLRIVDIVPYGALLGGGNTTLWWRERLEQKANWRRLIGWALTDERLFSFILWLEEHIVWRLPSASVGRLMVVLQDDCDAELENQAWLGRQSALQNELVRMTRADLMLARLGINEQGRAELSAHLEHPRNCGVFYRLLDALADRLPACDLWSAVPENRSMFELWRQHEKTDQLAMNILQDWSKPPFPALQDFGVPLAEGIQYNLYSSLLQHQSAIFATPEST